MMLQGSPDLRAGLDTLYGGDFPRAAAYFARLGAAHPADPAPIVFQAGAYIWWAAARDSADFAAPRIDSLLDLALARARAASTDFWLATALGYRARQREEHGHAFGAAKDAKAMRTLYARVLAADSACADCYLGLGVYEYGLARAGTLARIFAKLIGLGSGNAERGIRYMRRAAHDGDLARVEATWVLAAALVREAARDPAGRAVLEREARSYVQQLAARYPGNPVFQRFLRETSVVGRKQLRALASEPVGAPACPAAAAVPLAAIRRRERREFAEHVVHVTLDGVGRDVEPLRDFFVAQSGRDQVFDFLLALRETNGARARGWSGCDVAAATTFDRPERWGRRKIGAAGDRANGLDDVIGRRVFHDESIRAAFDELMHVLLRRNEIHHDRFRVGRLRLDIREERLAVAIGERGIEQHDLRFGFPQLLRPRAGILDRRDHVDVGIRREQPAQSVAHQTIVFDDEHANARRAGRSDGLHCGTPFRPAPVHCAFAFRHAVFDSAPTLWRHSTFDATNCPRHTYPRLSAIYEPPVSPRQAPRGLVDSWRIPLLA